MPLEKQVGGLSVAARAAGYGFRGVEVDGGDVMACYAAAKEAHERARRGEGPTLIEAHVVRLTSHSSDDDQRRYRDPAEVEGDEATRRKAFFRAWNYLYNRILLFASLPFAKLDALTLQKRLREIGQTLPARQD